MMESNDSNERADPIYRYLPTTLPLLFLLHFLSLIPLTAYLQHLRYHTIYYSEQVDCLPEVDQVEGKQGDRSLEESGKR